ncbi:MULTISPECIES: DNA methyltransferase [unclassified Microcystis]|uniref:site-specific DNA-methyltransferase (adenine-specific) n=1 Tax=Microcystis flos-aquae Mf_QC_C_20070823_S10D TaxID=2486236 RepID=A0A552KT48_9CHRO|nr:MULTISPECIES: DNA methyltransferase [unclassified Microcystis]MCA2817458.1 class I SAM-dependent DNA methyltransferase [Microcystis sp. M085S1]MCA2856045.1 class I SAM-dependent DNA methyltransferase [Microcystis sp. M065S1]TRV11153.1 MAG: class I SAM-dependent DNA methyltransferase [Microcystis flos-aquae Mf_QC_C_20070823_S10D]TRV28726.1 MAG: class I SAM-dependent DNA methyltransferase [Microcystis flos-aquae Mf_QC_C_20070823_S20]MCA2630358.1 class I SAM-dependent DNA methyltransferase [Mi
MTTTLESLQEFIDFCQQHITGKERKEAQIFLDRFFRAFGHKGALEAGATYEEAITKGSKKGKTGFADLVWKPRVLIEMKKRGEDLSKHYPQAFEYWSRLVPNRPRYVLLCNFDQFWIFDFDLQIDEPVDRVNLNDLKNRVSAFNFMEVGNRTPIFQNNQVEITETAARRMGELFQLLKKRGHKSGFDELTAQRFILQCVLAMFAEDRGLLPRDLFISCVQECLNGGNSYDVLGGLFQQMNQPGITPVGKYQGVDYFNGGLFSIIHPIELTNKELEFLDVAARQDWSKIRPAIFGNIFEGTANAEERHTYGMHFTSEADIMKIVRPTISRYWEEKIEQAGTIGELNTLQLELQQYKVLDPACGSGNFLYVAYQELKRIEQLLIEKIANRRRSASDQLQISFVTPKQFYGMDINPFAVELARVTLMIARKVAIDRFNLTEASLPLDTLDSNIICADALFTDWQKADAIIGNPPFLGGNKVRLELGDKYIEKVFNKFADVKDKVDFCTYWFRLANDSLNQKGRAGLVGSNSIRQGLARKASLDYINENNGYIHEAITTQVWSGEAAVHVSIVNWCYEQPKAYYLDNQLVEKINSSLTSTVDVSQANIIKANSNYAFKGVQPTGKGFIITEEEVQKYIKDNNNNRTVLKQFLDAKDLARRPHGQPSRWIIDFNNMSLEDASEYKLPFEHIKLTVKLEREQNRREVTRLTWWKFGEKRPGMRKAIEKLSFYFAIPRVSKWFIFLPIDSKYLSSDLAVVIASEDFYVLAILTSNIHRIWIKAQSSTLEDRTRYTHNTCFETFPFPQKPSQELVEKIRQTAGELHEYRSQQMEKKQWGITKLYNQFFNEPSSQLYQLHQKLDKLVMEAYHFQADEDILEKLLTLNLELAEKEKRGETVIGPWSPYS